MIAPGSARPRQGAVCSAALLRGPGSLVEPLTAVLPDAALLGEGLRPTRWTGALTPMRGIRSRCRELVQGIAAPRKEVR